MIKLALIGKNIAHSMSAQVYRSLLSQEIYYKLIDCNSESEIPTVESLFEEFDGISITAPYKKHFLDKIEVLEEFQNLQAINCIRSKNGVFQGINTDYLGVKEIMTSYIEQYGEMQVVLLGDGVMSKITQKCLKRMRVPFHMFSRKKDFDLTNLDISSVLSLDDIKRPLVINTCAREFVFKGNIPNTSVFLDYNYNLKAHQSSIPGKVFEYVDGSQLLEKQALHAISFWDISL